MRTLVVLIPLASLAAGTLGAIIQRSARAQTPKAPQVLFVSREFWKPGHEAALHRIEAEAARVCIGLGVPHPYLGIESLTGTKEVWYINGFASTEELTQVGEAYKKNSGLLDAMNRFSGERAEFESEPSTELTVRYRPEISRGSGWEIGKQEFLVIEITNGKPHLDGNVFEAQDGKRIVITPVKTRAEAETKLSTAGPEAKVFVVRPEFSMPAAEWVAGNRAFWSSRAPEK